MEQYGNKMEMLKWVDPKKEGEKKEAPPSVPSAALTKTNTKKLDPILKVVFHLNQEKQPKQKVVDLDEEAPKTLLQFDLNYWESDKIRQFANSEEMIEIAPF